MVHKMRPIFTDYVQIFQSVTPDDAEFRKQIIGVPFWAEGQEFQVTRMSSCAGVLVHYKIRRGGVMSNGKTAGGLQRATL